MSDGMDMPADGMDEEEKKDDGMGGGDGASGDEAPADGPSEDPV